MQSLHSIAFVVFWTCAALVLYTYVIYPVLLIVLGSLRRETPVPEAVRDDELPLVSVLVVAHNEAGIIRERIENLLALDYPSENSSSRSRLMPAATAPSTSCRSTQGRP